MQTYVISYTDLRETALNTIEIQARTENAAANTFLRTSFQVRIISIAVK